MLSSSEKYELKKKFRHLEAEICKTETALDSKADLVDGVVPTSQLPITQDIIDALNNANAPDGTNYFTTLADLSSITPGTLINVAANYSALPAANTVPGEFYWVENSQGTSWLPGPLGGTYYPNGLYYSNGTTWIFTDVPFNATQVEVDAGLNNNKFVTPQTFANASKWGTKQDTVTLTTTGTSGAATLISNTLNVPNYSLSGLGGVPTSRSITINGTAQDLSADRTFNVGTVTNVSALTLGTTGTDVSSSVANGTTTPTITLNIPTASATNRGALSSTDWTTFNNKQDTVSLTTTGTSGAATLVGSTLNIPQYQGVLTNPVTGTGTAGQVAYFNGTSAVTGSANLTWNGSQLNILTPSVLNTRETILKAQISDAGNDAFFIGNGTSVNGAFYPLFAGFGSNSSPGRAGLSFAGIVNPTSDIFGDASTSVIEYRAYKVPIGTDPLNETRNDVSNRILFSFFNNNTTILSMFPNGNISIGVPSSTPPSARLHVRGSGTTSATTALLVQNNTPSALLTVTDDGQTTLSPTANTSALVSSTYSVTGSGTTPLINLSGTWNTTGLPSLITSNITDTASNALSNLMLFRINGTQAFRVTKDGGIYMGDPSVFNGGIRPSGLTLNIASGVSGSSVDNDFTFGSAQGVRSYTSGTSSVLQIRFGAGQAFAPTSGTGILNIINIPTTINQTGGANGITRGLYVNPTLMSAADWRSVEFSNNTGWGLYGAGTAPNYLGGALGIGGTVDTTTSYNLRVSRQFSGGTVGRGIVSDSQITAGPSSISYFSTAASATATANVTDIRHFYATQSTFTSGAVVFNQSGFSVSDALVGGTNNFGFRGAILSGTGRWNLYMDGTAANYLAGNTSIGTTTESARLLIRGSGTTSATTALLVQNSTPSSLLSITDDGSIGVGNSANKVLIRPVGSGGTLDLNGDAIALIAQNVFSSSSVGSINITGNTLINTSGFYPLLNIYRQFAPTSGSAQTYYINIVPTINQTGGASGATMGIRVAPGLTAAADWRSIQFENNSGWGIYGTGTANNYLAGSLLIGSTSATTSHLAVGKTMTSSGGSGILSNFQVGSAVTTVYGFRSRMFSGAGTYTVSDAYHFSADVTSPDVSSGFTNQYGFYAQSSMTGATNNYGFYGNIASGTGRWNLYMNGTAANYLAGNTSIGTAASSGRLTVRGSGTTSATNGLLVEDSGGTDTFTIRDDGGFAFRNGTVGLAQTGYTTFTNLTTDRTCDANATTVEELADILGTLIEDLKTKGIIAA